MALAAAPLASDTLSGMSLGPRAQPAKYIPDFVESTGRALICLSLKKPFSSSSIPRISARFLLLLFGIMVVESITRSPLI
jgi:hypothetical protein